jgi:membrane-associated protein
VLLLVAAMGQTGWLTDSVGSSPVTYAVVFLAAMLDAFFPVVPSETIVITAGVVAHDSSLSIALVIPAAAAGAFVGDNISFVLGRYVGDPVRRRLFGSAKGERRIQQTELLLQRHGAILIVVARFIPGGRTAVTFAAGALEYRWRRFVLFDAVAATIWALYSGLLGYLGGETFENSTWKSLALALGIAAAVGLLAEVYRRIQKARGRDLLGAEEG